MSDNAEQAVVEQAVNNEVTTAEAVEQPQFTELESWDDGDDIEITPTDRDWETTACSALSLINPP